MSRKNILYVVMVTALVVLSAVMRGMNGTAPAASAEPAFVEPVIGMEFAFIRGGCFDMGDAFGDGDKAERPVHNVYVDDFYLGTYDVTVGAFRKFVRATGYTTEAERSNGCAVWTGGIWRYDAGKNWRTPGFAQDDRHPVVCVSWNDAEAFAKWLSRSGAKRYRLPSEAEWEYAARSGGKHYKYAWGVDGPSANIADETLKRSVSGLTIWSGYDDRYVYTSPVGSFRPNELGLYDMTGNVWQWTADWFDETYYRESLTDNPKGPYSGQYRVLRGGAWSNGEHPVRVTFRNRRLPSDRSSYFGFRLLAASASVLDGAIVSSGRIVIGKALSPR